MSAKYHLKVVLCWHMHQPEYRDLVGGEYQLPWVYLHSIKDYVDMAAHLAAVPKAQAVINFAPVLLDQIDDYTKQISAYLKGGSALRDPLLAALDTAVWPMSQGERWILIRTCLRANKERLIDPYPAYHRLAQLAAWLEDKPDAVMYLDEQYLSDLLVWYHLAWLGETVRRSDARVAALISKATGFTAQDRRALLEVIGQLLAGVIVRYRTLAESGQIELSVNPYAHPILPLLQDFTSAREATPNTSLPTLQAYPGGDERARWHVEQGIATFEHHFGFRPRGCWPAEGGISVDTLRLLSDYGFKWAASGGSVLHNSLQASGNTVQPADLCKPYRLNGGGDIACFFRDDALSDLVGFTYANWHADDAVANLINHLEKVAESSTEGNQILPIILDGENAWEYYPQNGYYFLSALYQRLAAHPYIELTTFSKCLQNNTTQMGKLPRLVAGSWVYGNFSTWIGDQDKNRAWDLLGKAKQAYDRAIKSGHLTGELLKTAEQQLAICEGSDWFWWFGDYNPSATVHDFDRLFRLHLVNLYHMIGEEVPSELARVISRGGGSLKTVGTMRPGTVNS